jgi:hypothetical protein
MSPQDEDDHMVRTISTGVVAAVAVCGGLMAGVHFNEPLNKMVGDAAPTQEPMMVYWVPESMPSEPVKCEAECFEPEANDGPVRGAKVLVSKNSVSGYLAERALTDHGLQMEEARAPKSYRLYYLFGSIAGVIGLAGFTFPRLRMILEENAKVAAEDKRKQEEKEAAKAAEDARYAEIERLMEAMTAEVKAPLFPGSGTIDNDVFAHAANFALTGQNFLCWLGKSEKLSILKRLEKKEEFDAVVNDAAIALDNMRVAVARLLTSQYGRIKKTWDLTVLQRASLNLATMATRMDSVKLWDVTC